MRKSRRQFLLEGVATAALGSVTRLPSATAGDTDGRSEPGPSPDEQLTMLLDQLFERILDISPQLAATLARNLDTNSRAPIGLDDETPEGQERRRDVADTLLTKLREFDHSKLSLRGRLDYEAVLFSVSAEQSARERFTFGRVDRRISPYVVSHLTGSYIDAPEFILASRQHAPSPGGDQLDTLLTRGDLFQGWGSIEVTAQQILDERVIPALSQQIGLLDSFRGSAPHDAQWGRMKSCEGCYPAA